MNISAIKRNCLNRGVADVLNMVDCGQWISSGSAAWPVENLRMDMDGLASLFNLKPKKRAAMLMAEKGWYDPRFSLEPLDDEEACAELGAVIYMEEPVVVLKTRQGLLYIREAPIHHIKDIARRYAARWENGRPLVAVYNGLLVGALVSPMDDSDVESIRRMAAAMSQEPFRWDRGAADAEQAAEAITREMEMG